MAATVEFMHATGPLIAPDDGFAYEAAPAATLEARSYAPLTTSITIRCVDAAGRDLATSITVRPDQPLRVEALRLVILDREHGTCSAIRFGKSVFHALRDLDERPALTGRDRVIQRKLRELDRLAIAGFDHGTITW